MPEISVIVPVYKVENYIHRCVDSILNQTFTDFELILVDDGSPDNCGAICDEYAAKDSRVVVIHQENGGLSAARNTGIDWAFANSDSKWITFIDSDDWVHPQYLELLVVCAEKNAVDLCVASFEYADLILPMPDITERQAYLCDPAEAYIDYYDSVMPAWCKLYKKKLFINIRYPVGKLCEDAFTTYKLLFAVEKIGIVDNPLYYYFRNQQGIMRSSWKPAKLDEMEGLEEQIAFFDKKHLISCKNCVRGNYIRRLCAQIIDIKKSGWANSVYEKKLRWKLRHQLVCYRNLCPFSNNKSTYEQAFPKAMWCYWTCCALIGKIRRGK